MCRPSLTLTALPLRCRPSLSPFAARLAATVCSLPPYARRRVPDPARAALSSTLYVSHSTPPPTPLTRRPHLRNPGVASLPLRTASLRATSCRRDPDPSVHPANCCRHFEPDPSVHACCLSPVGSGKRLDWKRTENRILVEMRVQSLSLRFDENITSINRLQNQHFQQLLWHPLRNEDRELDAFDNLVEWHVFFLPNPSLCDQEDDHMVFGSAFMAP
ncbi:hypothetical protein U1Q18_002660 [Sarracenia purpurea var. burkii]